MSKLALVGGLGGPWPFPMRASAWRPPAVRWYAPTTVRSSILSAETSAEFEEVQSIRYVMREILEEIGRAPEFFDAYEGSLEFAGPGMADFGKGPAPTNTWDTAIEEVIAPQPYHLELTALDSEGQPLCTVEKRLDIVADAVAQIYVAMPCTDGVASP